MRLPENYPTNLLKLTLNVILICVLMVGTAFAKGPADILKITIIPIVDGKPDAGSYVKLYYADQPVLLSSSSGFMKNVFILKRDADYTIVISKSGFPDKVVNVSTKLPAEGSLPELYVYKMKVELPCQTDINGEKVVSAINIAFNEETKTFDENNAKQVIVAR